MNKEERNVYAIVNDVYTDDTYDESCHQVIEIYSTELKAIRALIKILRNEYDGFEDVTLETLEDLLSDNKFQNYCENTAYIPYVQKFTLK